MSRYGIMATQLLATLVTAHHPPKCEIVVHLVNLCHLSHSIPLAVCSVSQLERCFSVSLHELILSCSIFNKIDPSRVFPFLSLSCWLEFSETHQDKDGGWINVLMKCHLDHEDCVSLRSPFILPYAWISGRDSCLVGVSFHNPSQCMH